MVTESEKNQILDISRQLRKRAEPVGPLHSFWDDIFEMEALATDRPTILSMSAQDWIKKGQELLTHPEMHLEKQLRDAIETHRLIRETFG